MVANRTIRHGLTKCVNIHLLLYNDADLSISYSAGLKMHTYGRFPSSTPQHKTPRLHPSTSHYLNSPHVSSEYNTHPNHGIEHRSRRRQRFRLGWRCGEQQPMGWRDGWSRGSSKTHIWGEAGSRMFCEGCGKSDNQRWLHREGD